MGERKTWVRPKVQKIVAGAAETRGKTGTPDGGTSANQTNFS